MTDTTVARSTKGPPFRPSLITLLVGLAMGIPAVVVVVMTFWGVVFGSTAHRVPGSFEVNLGSGEYLVFERTGGESRFGVVSVGSYRGVTIGPGDVVVVGEDGYRVPVEGTSADEFIERNDERFVSAVKFDVPSEGTYRVDVRAPDTTEVIVQRSLGKAFGDKSGWLALGGAGWLLALVGVTLLLVGVIRRGRDVRQAREAMASVAYAAAMTSAATAVAPAGWYADPHGQHVWRYWDGTRWTEHTA
jgi:hypothetical protein